MADFVMPSLGADMTAGVLVAWRKKLGDSVRRGDILAEVETDKGLIEVEVFNTGVVEKILVESGARVPVGTLMAIIQEEGEALAGEPGALAKGTVGVEPGGPVHVATTEIPQSGPAPSVSEIRRVSDLPPAPRVPISPAARKLAAELGINPAAVTGSGPGGRITRHDIARAASTQAAPSGEVMANRQSRMRQAIASAMTRSKREIPHYYNLGRWPGFPRFPFLFSLRESE